MAYSTDPRATRSREAMLVAARQLLAGEGPGAVTYQRVAQLAGVGRATVYRHWPRSEQLLLDVMSGTHLPLFKDPEPPVRPWLQRQLRQLAEELRVPTVAAAWLALMQSALWDPEIARRHDESLQTISGRIGVAVRLAVAGGELQTDTDPHDLSPMLVGPIVHRTVMERRDACDDFVDRLIAGIGVWRG